MASAWIRTAAELRIDGHYVGMVRQSTFGESFARAWVPWADDAVIAAEVWRQAFKSWAWIVRQGGREVAKGQASTDAGARAAAKRRISPLVVENRKRFTESDDVTKYLGHGYTVQGAAG